MNYSYPVYTIDAECQDCYKCVRNCPVKAIQVQSGHAKVISERCIACGKCVEVCPAKAKQFRNDTAKVKNLLKKPVKVYASLAPSWISEFNHLNKSQMIHALRALGFAGVSETAIGAQIVSQNVAKDLDSDHGKGKLLISSACPATVDFIRKYHPELAENITQVSSPLLAHCRFLRDTFGENIGVVFIGPCIAKKNEADRHPELLDYALTYPEIKQMWREADINPAEFAPSAEDDVFVPVEAEEGARYPIEGGMNDTLKFQTNPKVHYAALSGIKNIRTAIKDLPKDLGGETVFLETLACPGGCVHGPCTEHNSPGILEWLRVIKNSNFPQAPKHRKTHEIALDYPRDDVKKSEHTAEELTHALQSIGKYTAEDELNCSSCGYDSCRNFADALLDGRAEPSMCVSFLKKQAQKKANALLRSISSGVVICDKNLQIVESNRNFAELFGEDTLMAYDACPGMAGADLRRIVPFYSLFESALATGKEVRRDSLKHKNRLFYVNVFTIEPHETVGAVIIDVTKSEMRREQIAGRARQVIDNNLSTVQEIAARLGEQMADTELLLRSIADDYAKNNSGE